MSFRAPTEETWLYLDNAATSFPKPAQVGAAMVDFLDLIGGTYGRSGHWRAVETARMVFEARQLLATRLGARDSSRIAFASGATLALNLALCSLAVPGSRVLVCPLAHNAVMRPLEQLRQERGLRLETLPCEGDGFIRVQDLRETNGVSLAVVTAESNVNGVRQPLAALKAKLGQTPLVVDAAQGDVAGLSDERLGLDVVAIAGHKSLLGPPGTGAIYVRPGLELQPLVRGGTGSRSDSYEHPSQMPERLEAGTPNTVGIAGLLASLRFLDESGEGPERRLASFALARLREMEGIEVYCASSTDRQGGCFSFNVQGMSCSTTAAELERRHGFLLRAGLHCAPMAHRSLGTLDRSGAVRVSFGRFHTDESVERFLRGVRDFLEARRPA